MAKKALRTRYELHKTPEGQEVRIYEKRFKRRKKLLEVLPVRKGQKPGEVIPQDNDDQGQ